MSSPAPVGLCCSSRKTIQSSTSSRGKSRRHLAGPWATRCSSGTRAIANGISSWFACAGREAVLPFSEDTSICCAESAALQSKTSEECSTIGLAGRSPHSKHLAGMTRDSKRIFKWHTRFRPCPQGRNRGHASRGGNRTRQDGRPDGPSPPPPRRVGGNLLSANCQRVRRQEQTPAVRETGGFSTRRSRSRGHHPRLRA